jgi:hypothetical protein
MQKLPSPACGGGTEGEGGTKGSTLFFINIPSNPFPPLRLGVKPFWMGNYRSCVPMKRHGGGLYFEYGAISAVAAKLGVSHYPSPAGAVVRYSRKTVAPLKRRTRCRISRTLTVANT